MIYEYDCEPCEGYYELEMKLSEYESINEGNSPHPTCPSCGKNLRRIITKAPSFKLLGHGWYNMDYGITDMEMNKNLDDEKRMEGIALKEQQKASNISEI